MKLEKPPAGLSLQLYHGLLSSPQEFGMMAHVLRSRGIVHQAPEIAGYSLGCGPAVLDWRVWRDAATAGLRSVVPVGAWPVSGSPATGRTEVDATAPVILGGLCMGGMLALTAAAAAPRRVAGVVLMSPTFAYDGWAQSPIRHLRHVGYWTGLDRFFSVRERHPFGVKNEKIRKWIIDELTRRKTSAAGPVRIPLRALREADRMMHAARRHLAQLRCPLLVIHAREDEITSLASVQRVFDALPQADKELVVLENSYHMVSIDNDRQRVAATIADFVTRISERHAIARHGSELLATQPVAATHLHAA